MLDDRIYVLEPDFPEPDDDYICDVQPTLLDAGIKIAKYFRSNVANPNADCQLLFLDQGHFFYNDGDFLAYLRKTLQHSDFDAIGFIDCPFVDPVQFEPQFVISVLTERYKLLHDMVRFSHPKALILSPVMCHLNEDRFNCYLDLFMKCRNYFDVYSLAAYHDFSDSVIAQANTFVTEVLSMLKKNVWVTHLAIPSAKDKMQGFMTYEKAALALKNYFYMINALAGNQTKWFLPALGKDGSITNRPFESLYYFNNRIRSNIGLLDKEGHRKEPILNAMLDMASIIKKE